jgi:hypothetical protein
MSTVTAIGASAASLLSDGAGAVVPDELWGIDIIESLWRVVAGATGAAAARGDPSSPPQAAVPAARVMTASPTRS